MADTPPGIDVGRYLRRLGFDGDPGPPSAEALRALHRAHVERVPYETLEIQLGRPTTIDPGESAERILRGRGGYCYHLNGAFALLLTALGYDVSWHVGGVQSWDDPEPVGANGNHLALTVGCEGREWFADVGLGDGLHEPLPLASGTYAQGPFTYGLDRSRAVPGGWRFDHDAACGFAGMDFESSPPANLDAFRARHRFLSTSPESGAVRVASAVRRDAGGVDQLTGRVLKRLDATGRSERELTTAPDWYAALADVFGLTLDEIAPNGRRALWRRVRAAHVAWSEGQQRTNAFVED